MTTSLDIDLEKSFMELVSGIEELEDLTAPGWWNSNAAFWGATVAGAVITGIAIT